MDPIERLSDAARNEAMTDFNTRPTPETDAMINWCADRCWPVNTAPLRQCLDSHEKLEKQRDVLLEALQEVRWGLLWYQNSFPAATDGSDDEAMARIDAAIQFATQQQPEM